MVEFCRVMIYLHVYALFVVILLPIDSFDDLSVDSTLLKTF